jgi:GDPmannose 4,6-dehydratase
MWLVLQQKEAEDLVLATGITTKVRNFVAVGFREICVELAWSGEGAHETGTIASVSKSDFPSALGAEVVAVDPRYFRSTKVELLLGDPAKAKEKLG